MSLDRDPPPSSLAARARRFGAAAVSGLLLFVAYTDAGSGVGLAFIALVPLLLALDGLAPRAATRVGYVAGLSFNIAGYYWLVGTIQVFGGFSLPICLLFFAILCAYQAIAWALVGWLQARMRGALPRELAPMIAMALAVAAVEIAFPPLFPSYVGATLHALPRVLQGADLGGPILLSLLVVAVNAGVAGLVQALWRRAPLPRAALAVASTLFVAAGVYGELRIRQIDALASAAPRLRVGIVQANIGILQREDNPTAAHRRHLAQTIALQDEHEPDLIVWPESGYYYVLPDGLRNLRALVTGPDLRTPLLFGGARRDARGRTFNTAFLLDAAGNVLGTYDKTYLLMFGEYLPFGELMPVLYTLSPATGRHAKGEHVRPFVLGEWRITTLICFEDLLPAFTRRAVAEGDPHLLVNITNDSWFGDTLEPWLHLGLSKLRAVEHHRYLVRATNTGVSAVIDPVGRVVQHGGVLRRESLHEEVGLLRPWTLYRVVGDVLGWGALGISLWLAMLRWRK